MCVLIALFLQSVTDATHTLLEYFAVGPSEGTAGQALVHNSAVLHLPS